MNTNNFIPISSSDETPAMEVESADNSQHNDDDDNNDDVNIVPPSISFERCGENSVEDEVFVLSAPNSFWLMKTDWV